MASTQSIAMRKAQALDRLNKAAESIAETHRVDKPDLLLRAGYAPEFAAMLQLETLANWLENIQSAIGAAKAKGTAQDAALAQAEATRLAEKLEAETEADAEAEPEADKPKGSAKGGK